MSDKEYLAQRSELGSMPRLNQVFEELGIHHEEHVVPSKVLASIEKKQKVVAKNATAIAESKKRKGQASSKTLSKRQKIEATSVVSASPATSSASVSEEGSVENTGGAQDTFTGGDAPVNLASTRGGGAEGMEVAAEASESLREATMVSVEAAGASVEDSFLDVLGEDSIPDASKASPIHAVEVPNLGARRIVGRCLKKRRIRQMLRGLLRLRHSPFTLVRMSFFFVVFGLYFLLSNVIFA
jgi:hypothetical protein